MKKLLAIFSLLGALALSSVHAGVAVGQTAPDFTLTDVKGKEVSLSDFRGQFVVLEWVNPGCPFVVKFYNIGAMQRFQKEAKEMGAVWLAINSTNPNHNDFMCVETTKAYIDERNVPAPWLMDKDGTVGRTFGATRTPEMFIINPEGVVIYHGAIDSIRSANSADVERAENFVMAALTAAKAGEEIAVPQTRPYGCTIKF